MQFRRCLRHFLNKFSIEPIVEYSVLCILRAAAIESLSFSAVPIISAVHHVFFNYDKPDRFNE